MSRYIIGKVSKEQDGYSFTGMTINKGWTILGTGLAIYGVYSLFRITNKVIDRIDESTKNKKLNK